MNRELRAGGSWDRRNGTRGTGAAAIYWTPSRLTTALWFDADDSSTITTVSGAVSQWNDKSGNTRNASQGTEANRPTVISNGQNGRSVIRFDGSNDSFNFDGSFVANTSYTVVGVITRRSNKSVNFFLGNNNNTLTNRSLIIGWETNTTFRFAQFNNDIDATVASYSSPSPDLFVCTLNTSSGRKTFLNGTEAATSATTTAIIQNNNASLGSYIGPPYYFEGDIAEVVALTSAVSDTNRQYLEGYLANKWGLTANLPANHPFKNFWPTTSQ